MRLCLSVCIYGHIFLGRQSLLHQIFNRILAPKEVKKHHAFRRAGCCAYSTRGYGDPGPCSLMALTHICSCLHCPLEWEPSRKAELCWETLGAWQDDWGYMVLHWVFWGRKRLYVPDLNIIGFRLSPRIFASYMRTKDDSRLSVACQLH